MYLIFDTETTGLPKRYGAPVTEIDNWPRVVQLAWQLYDSQRRVIDDGNLIIKPVGFTIPDDAARVHGITTERALREGVDLAFALSRFGGAVNRAQEIIAHNLGYDEPVTHAEHLRIGLEFPFGNHVRTCTMLAGKGFCRLPSPSGRGFKSPKLIELYRALFNRDFTGAHDAKVDVSACAECCFEMKDRGILR